MARAFKDTFYGFQLGNRRWQSVALIVVDLYQLRKIP